MKSHLDHLGTPRVITDPNGNVISKHKYLPFGEELSAPASTNTHEFTGHERDKETGLDYMLGRHFSPLSSRFMSPDPLAATIVECPQSWNRYAYVQNKPMNFIDPTGHEFKNSATDPATQVSFEYFQHDPVLKGYFGGQNQHNLEMVNIGYAFDKDGKYFPLGFTEVGADGNVTVSILTIDPDSGRDLNSSEIFETVSHEIGHVINQGIAGLPGGNTNHSQAGADAAGYESMKRAAAAQGTKMPDNPPEYVCGACVGPTVDPVEEYFNQGLKDAEESRRASASQPGFRSADPGSRRGY